MNLQKNLKFCEADTANQLPEKFRRTLLLSLLIILSNSFNCLIAQDLIRDTQNGINAIPAFIDTSLVYQNLESDWQDVQFTNGVPASFNESSPVKIDAFLDYGVVLKLEDNYIKQLINTKPEKLMLEVPVSNSNYFELQLSKIDIVTEAFKIKTSSGSTVKSNASTELFYWGIVKNNPGSIAAVSIYNNEVRCVIADKDGNYVMGAYEDALVLYNDKDIKLPFNFNCTTTNDFFGKGADVFGTQQTNTLLEDFVNLKAIEINVECDYSMYLAFNADIDAVKNYVMALFNESAILYANENIKIKLSEIFIWTSADFYASINGTAEMLNTFAVERKDDFQGKVGMLLTNRILPDSSTGHAYLNGLCSSSWSFGVAKIFNTDEVIPVSSYSRDVFTFTHELGHIFGSPHTQNCAWGPNQNQALDNCAPVFPKNGCNEGPPITDGGTIMSYCVFDPNFINFDKGFGDEPGDLIRANIESASCVDVDSCAIAYNQQVFLDNPWLNNEIVSSLCKSTEIYVYDGVYHWVYLKSPVANNLYFNGSLYCSGSADYNCFELYEQYLTEVTASSCACNEIEICPPQTCNTNPCLEGGIKVLNQNTCECEIFGPTVTGCDDPTAANYDATVNCPDPDSCIPLVCDSDEIFTTYPWLNNLINFNNCAGTTISVYDATYYKFVYVETNNSGTLYFQNGTYYCTSTGSYFCPESFGLSKIINCWTCEDNCAISGCTDSTACNYTPDACEDDGTCVYLSNEGTVFYETCDDGVQYYLIGLADGTIVDPYNAEGVNFGYAAGATVEFGYSVSYNSPCSIANMAVDIVCITEINPTPCNYNSKGEVFYRYCDDGIKYYLIELLDGTIIDPYDNFNFTNFDFIAGAEVEFTYEPIGNPACSLAEMAVEIICIKEVDPCSQNPEIFDTYPFLATLINPDSCNGESISASSYFFIVETENGQSLYLDTGVFYCDYESCIDYYLPDGAPCVWSCQGNASKSNNNTNLSLKKKDKPFIEILPNPNNGHFTLKINNGKEENNLGGEVQLFSLEGRLLKKIDYADNQTTFNISAFGKGVYLLAVTSAGSKVVKKLIIN